MKTIDDLVEEARRDGTFAIPGTMNGVPYIVVSAIGRDALVLLATLRRMKGETLKESGNKGEEHGDNANDLESRIENQ